MERRFELKVKAIQLLRKRKDERVDKETKAVRKAKINLERK